MAPKTFDEFIAPLAPAKFLQEVYGQHPVYLSGKSDRFADLLPWDALNAILQQHRLDAPRFRLAKQGTNPPKESYLRYIRSNQETRIPRLDLAALISELQQGATIVLSSIDEAYEPISELSAILERVLSNHVQVNAYAGWQSMQGFDTHWDDHGVFILQLFGRKHWRVFEPTLLHPLPEDKSEGSAEAPKMLHWEGDLNPGDLLYMPRGWWHDAVPTGGPTLHLTCAISRVTGVDFAQRVLERLREQQFMRADLPRFATLEEQHQYMTTFRETLMGVFQGLSLQRYFLEVDQNAPGRVRPSLPWSAMPDSQELTETMWIKWLPPRKVAFERVESKIAFRAMGINFTLEEIALPIVETLEGRRLISFGELCAIHQLSPNPRITRLSIEPFIKELISRGLIAVVTGSEWQA